MRALGQRVRGGALEALDLPAYGPLADREVEVLVEHCSVCHSDVHLLDGDWGDVARPLVPGHEIVGRVVAAGSAAGIRAGTVVGIGWQAGACGACPACTTARPHLCTGGKKRTCVGRVGGFAETVRVDAEFCFELPNDIDRRAAAPLFCAGVTVFSPLDRFGVRAGMRIGVVGVGGLGHLAVRFASKMGAEVVAFDPDPKKRDLARSLGASDLVDTRGPLPQGAVDIILVTTHATLDLDAWMRVLTLEGTLCLVGIPTARLDLSAAALLDEQKKLTGSVIGSPKAIRRMLAFASVHGIAPIVERMPMASATEAIDRVRAGRARMRIVLDA